MTVKRKGKKGNTQFPGRSCLLAGVGFLEEFIITGFFWRYKKSMMDVFFVGFVVFLLASLFFKVDDAVVAGCLGIVVVVVMRKKGSVLM